MRRLARFALLAALALPACANEDPITIGGSLVENGVVRTFEVTLNGSDYLVRDTSFASFPPPLNSFAVIAKTYEGVLNANALARFNVTPSLGLQDSAGVVRVDSAPRIQRGRIVVRVDTIASAFSGPVQMRLYRAAEMWDTATVTWTRRLVNGTTNVLWATPGGTKGVLLDTATYTGGDSVVFRVDTATIKAWRDSVDTSPGAIITVETPNTRLRTVVPQLRVEYRTTIVDTVVTSTFFPFATRFITDPVVAPASSDPRVGGVPLSYRTVFELRPDIADLQIPCPFSATCRVRLKDASIASASLLLEPIAAAPGFKPELPITVLAYSLLPTAQVPLSRSPLGVAAGFITIAPGSFTSTNTAPASLPITTFMRNLVAPIDTTTFNSRYLTLLQGVPATFGYASFRGQPRLRLRLSVAQEVQLP